ncbi:MAG: VCBS repeat-containing protein, partial [Phycisphaerales bacterium]|nr:VCBS repeat-containing protein [Phycisphaerales bacterium]
FSDFDFAPPIIFQFPNAQSPTMFIAADLDGDDAIDLIVPGRSLEHQIYLLRGAGDGTFPLAMATTIQLEEQAQWVALATLDADEHPDLAVIVRGVTSKLVIIRGLGGFAFDVDNAVVIHLPDRQGENVEAHDFDGDGDLDLGIVMQRTDSMLVYRNDGAAGFTLDERVLVDETTTGYAFPSSLIADDFDGDGDLDVAMSEVATARVAVAMNTGRGHFGEELLHQPVFGAPSMNIADLDADGDRDLLVPGGTLVFQGYVTLLRNQQDGTFGGFDGITTTFTGPSGFTWHAAAGDFDGDGDLDVVSGQVLAASVGFVERTDEGELTFAFPIQFGEIGTFIRYVQPVDVDGDGDLDLIAADIGEHWLLVYLNQTVQGATPAGAGGSPPARDPSIAALASAVAALPRASALTVQAMLADWGPVVGAGEFDLTGDGRVDFDDIASFVGLTSEGAAAGDPPPPPDECTKDAGPCDEPNGSPGCDNLECCAIVCDFDAFCCDVEWDETCVEGWANLCEPPPVCPSPGSCFEAHDNPGCDDPACCELICIIDPLCCDVDAVWDSVCAAEAQRLCTQDACEVVCPPGAVLEAFDECEERFNEGCSAGAVPMLTPIACGDTVCALINTGPRDTDWYELELVEPATVTWTVTSEFPSQVFVVQGDCDVRFGIIGQAYGGACTPASVTLNLDPGIYGLYVATGTPVRKYIRGVPCPPDKKKGEEPAPQAYGRVYVAAIGCEAPNACPADLSGDGTVGPPDLAALLAAWGAGAGSPADLDGNGTVGPPDLAILLASWGACPAS